MQCITGKDYSGPATKLCAEDVTDAAKDVPCSPYSIKTVIAVETGGHGFDPCGRPIILYEPHVMWRVVKNDPQLQQQLAAAGLAYPVWGTRPYPPGQDAQYDRLDRVVAAAGPELAVRACSWGMGQVLGENFSMLKYASAAAMVADAVKSEALQLQQMMRFIASANLGGSLRSQSWYAFALGYNGKANAINYSGRLSRTYRVVASNVGVGYPADPGRVTINNAPDIMLHPARPADATPDTLAARWQVPPAAHLVDVTADDLNAQFLAQHPDGITA